MPWPEMGQKARRIQNQLEKYILKQKMCVHAQKKNEQGIQKEKIPSDKFQQ